MCYLGVSLYSRRVTPGKETAHDTSLDMPAGLYCARATTAQYIAQMRDIPFNFFSSPSFFCLFLLSEFLPVDEGKGKL